jgi:hypothetical protein
LQYRLKKHTAQRRVFLFAILTLMDTKTVFILLALVFVILLFIHHRFIHRSDGGKTRMQKWFEWSDVNNHETVEILLLWFIAGLLVASYL